MSRRRRTAGTGVSALLAVSLLASPTVPAGAADRGFKPFGRASSPDQVLQRGCNDYRLNYVVRPPTNEWSAVIQVYAPTGRKVTSLLLDVNTPDPRRGSKTFRICRASVTPGTFKISMNVVYTSGRDRLQGRVAPTYFTLKPRR